MNEVDWNHVQRAFAERFPEHEHKQRPGRGGMSFTYVDARAVQDRLDNVVGPQNWGIAFEIADAEKAAVKATLTVFGVSKQDFGYANNGEDSDEPLKQAASDALKRAACQFGIGRYLWQGGPNRGQQRPPQQQPQQHPNLLRASEEANREARAVANRIPPAPNHTGNGGGPVLPATEPQLRAIYAIGRAKQAMDDAEVEARCKELYGVTPSALSRKQASELIQALQGGEQ